MTPQILILMSGRDDAFRDAGYLYPKTLVEIDGMPLVQVVLDSLAELRKQASRVIVTIRREEDRKHHTGAVIRLVEPRADVVLVDETAGAACSALLAIEHIDPNLPLVIVNGDQILRADLPG